MRLVLLLSLFMSKETETQPNMLSSSRGKACWTKAVLHLTTWLYWPTKECAQRCGICGIICGRLCNLVKHIGCGVGDLEIVILGLPCISHVWSWANYPIYWRFLILKTVGIIPTVWQDSFDVWWSSGAEHSNVLPVMIISLPLADEVLPGTVLVTMGLLWAQHHIWQMFK